MMWQWTVIICTCIVCLTVLVAISMVYDTKGRA